MGQEQPDAGEAPSILIFWLGLSHRRGGGILYDLMPHSLKYSTCPGLTHGILALTWNRKHLFVGMKQRGRTRKAVVVALTDLRARRCSGRNWTLQRR